MPSGKAQQAVTPSTEFAMCLFYKIIQRLFEQLECFFQGQHKRKNLM